MRKYFVDNYDFSVVVIDKLETRNCEDYPYHVSYGDTKVLARENEIFDTKKEAIQGAIDQLNRCYTNKCIMMMEDFRETHRDLVATLKYVEQNHD